MKLLVVVCVLSTFICCWSLTSATTALDIQRYRAQLDQQQGRLLTTPDSKLRNVIQSQIACLQTTITILLRNQRPIKDGRSRRVVQMSSTDEQMLRHHRVRLADLRIRLANMDMKNVKIREVLTAQIAQLERDIDRLQRRPIKENSSIRRRRDIEVTTISHEEAQIRRIEEQIASLSESARRTDISSWLRNAFLRQVDHLRRQLADLRARVTTPDTVPV